MLAEMEVFYTNISHDVGDKINGCEDFLGMDRIKKINSILINL